MPETTSNYGLHILNFSKATVEQKKLSILKPYYMLSIVSKGTGYLRFKDSEYSISSGDIFLTIPHTIHNIETKGSIEIMTIEFMGIRGVELAKGLLDSRNTSVISGHTDLIEMWEKSFNEAISDNKNLLAEGLLIYTFGRIPGRKILKTQFKKREFTMFQTYIRSHFNDPNLSLESVSKVFGYNKKYLSDLFKKKYDIRFSDFIRNVRLENAVSLMQLGTSSISKIATLCGFNDPLYFSKLFKQKYGMSPKSYIEKLT